jgi:ATP-dependent phosphofructokinase / diphosphate-dependent phosphofructokinase
MKRKIGILTSGGDCPGLNAALRAVGKAGQGQGLQFVGFRDGFRGLVLDDTMKIDDRLLSGIITIGGTILGTSRDKPHRMMVNGVICDMTDAAVKVYQRHRLDALVCLGGGGTQKNALHLQKAGLNIITLPKTIDNDVPQTDVSFGFDTALEIATDAIDRLHSTAMSHGRIIVVEVMGHRAGWLALGAGIAGGADVILIPEIPYDVGRISETIRRRIKSGKNFNIIVVAEGAMSKNQANMIEKLVAEKNEARGKAQKNRASDALAEFHQHHVNHTMELTQRLEQLTGLESRLTILGHLQRGGSPSAGDRILATRLGVACAEYLQREKHGIMIASRGEGIEAVPLEMVAGKKKFVPLDHPWISSARRVGTCLGD